MRATIVAAVLLVAACPPPPPARPAVSRPDAAPAAGPPVTPLLLSLASQAVEVDMPRPALAGQALIPVPAPPKRTLAAQQARVDRARGAASYLLEVEALAALHLANGDPVEAHRSLSAALVSSEKVPAATIELAAQLAYAVGREAEAAALCARLLRDFPASPRTPEWRAWGALRRLALDDGDGATGLLGDVDPATDAPRLAYVHAWLRARFDLPGAWEELAEVARRWEDAAVREGLDHDLATLGCLAGVSPAAAAALADELATRAGEDPGDARLTLARSCRDAGALDPSPVPGPLDEASAGRALRDRLVVVRDCYARARLASPGLGGRLTLLLTVAPDGSAVIDEVRATGPDGLGAVAACVGERLQGLRFPSPGPGGARITVPLVLWPIVADDPPARLLAVQPSKKKTYDFEGDELESRRPTEILPPPRFPAASGRTVEEQRRLFAGAESAARDSEGRALAGLLWMENARPEARQLLRALAAFPEASPETLTLLAAVESASGDLAGAWPPLARLARGPAASPSLLAQLGFVACHGGVDVITAAALVEEVGARIGLGREPALRALAEKCDTAGPNGELALLERLLAMPLSPAAAAPVHLRASRVLAGLDRHAGAARHALQALADAPDRQAASDWAIELARSAARSFRLTRQERNRRAARLLHDTLLAGGQLQGKDAEIVFDLEPTSREPDVDKQSIRSQIRAWEGAIRGCHETLLLTSPDLQGTVTSRFLVLPGGKLQAIAITSDSTGSPALGACIAGHLANLTFPTTLGFQVNVTFPFTFRTAP